MPKTLVDIKHGIVHRELNCPLPVGAEQSSHACRYTIWCIVDLSQQTVNPVEPPAQLIPSISSGKYGKY